MQLDHLPTEVLAGILDYTALDSIMFLMVTGSWLLRRKMLSFAAQRIEIKPDTLGIPRVYSHQPLPPPRVWFQLKHLTEFIYFTDGSQYAHYPPIIYKQVQKFPPTLRKLHLRCTISSRAIMNAHYDWLRIPDSPSDIWLPLKDLFPSLQSLHLENTGQSKEADNLLSLEHCKTFLKCLPASLTRLFVYFLPGMDPHFLRLLPPDMLDLSVVFPLGLLRHAVPERMQPTAEGIKLLPPGLTSLNLVLHWPSPTSNVYLSSLPSTLRSLEVKIKALDDQDRFPPNLTRLRLTCSLSDAEFNKLVKHVPPTVTCLGVLTATFNLSAKSHEFASLLPKVLKHLELPNYNLDFTTDSAGSMLPYQLETFIAYGIAPSTQFVHRLPATLRHLECQVVSGPNFHWWIPGPKLDLLSMPPSITFLKLGSSKEYIMPEHLRHFKNLKTLQMSAATLDQDCLELLISPAYSSLRVSVGQVAANGRFLKDDVTIVDHEAVKRSLSLWFYSHRVPNLTHSGICSSEYLMACPPNAVAVNHLSLEKLRPKQLSRCLPQIHSPYAIDDLDELADLPPALTALNCKMRIPASQLYRLPTKVRLKRATVVLDEGIGPLKEWTDTNNLAVDMVFPDWVLSVASCVYNKHALVVTWEAPNIEQYLHLLREPYNSLVLKPVIDLSNYSLSLLPKSISTLSLGSVAQYRHLKEVLATHPMEQLRSLTCMVDSSCAPLLFPSQLTSLSVHGIKSALDFSSIIWPENIEQLTMTEWRFPLPLFLDLPTSITSLHLGSGSPPIFGPDVINFPRNLTSLRLDTARAFGKTCIDPMPPQLTSLVIPRGMMSSTVILNTIASRRAAVELATTSISSSST